MTDNDQPPPAKPFTSLIIGVLSLLFLFFFNIFIALILAILGVTFELVGTKESLDSDDIGIERLAVF